MIRWDVLETIDGCATMRMRGTDASSGRGVVLEREGELVEPRRASSLDAILTSIVLSSAPVKPCHTRNLRSRDRA